MNQQKINNIESSFFTIKNPNKEMLVGAINYLNANIIAGNFPYLMRKDIIDIAKVNNWYDEQVSGKSIRLIGIIEKSKIISIAYLQRGHGNSFHVAKLGITVEPKFQQKGVANVICNKLLKYGRDEGVVRVEAYPVVKNDNAIKFLSQLGFFTEGIALKKYRRDETTFYDCLHMAIIL